MDQYVQNQYEVMEYYYYNVRAIRRLKHICPWVRSGGQHMEHCHSCYLLMLALCQTETNRKNAAQHSLLLLCKYNLFDIITNVRYTLFVFVQMMNGRLCSCQLLQFLRVIQLWFVGVVICQYNKHIIKCIKLYHRVIAQVHNSKQQSASMYLFFFCLRQKRVFSFSLAFIVSYLLLK